MPDRRYHFWSNPFDAENGFIFDYDSPCPGSQGRYPSHGRSNSNDDNVPASSLPSATHLDRNPEPANSRRRRLLDPNFVYHDGFDPTHKDSFGGVWHALWLFG
ncbi:hypothetical protein DM02DRAFT_659937 [Periconia macrospinosa]|uniref:Uncharacterized protein n=1 Tax=Periconia macrospinosa TaxID=97972 RepID=A0A2V1DBY3_9PLEO|nr:hypothetical protein DM02DRAFT_659937 [Periconia macrospinosa]